MAAESHESGHSDLTHAGRSCGALPRSLPVTLGVSPKRFGETWVPFTAPHGSFGETDAAAEVGQPGGACDGVDGGRDGSECKREVQGYRETAFGENERPERREVFEAGPTKEQVYRFRFSGQVDDLNIRPPFC